MKNYADPDITFTGCPACAYAKHEFELPCGMAFENDRFTLSQDWEIPIEGFLIISPKRHVELFTDLEEDERNEMFSIIDKTMRVLRDNNVCEKFNVILYEGANTHLHVWIFPRHKWMRELAPKITENIGKIVEYAQENFRTQEALDRIKEVSIMVREKLS